MIPGANQDARPDQGKSPRSGASQQDMFRPCLVIPIYNNVATIAAVLDGVSDYGAPCIVVDDGSDDATRTVLEREAEKRAWVRVLHLPENRGKGVAVVAGLLHAAASGYSHAVQIDADGQHETGDVPRFLEEAANYPDALILGEPIYDETAPMARVYGRQLSRVWVWIETLSFSIKDPLFGFRVYPVRAAAALIRSQRLGSRMDFDPEIAVRLFWSGVPVRNIRTPVRYPPGGISHFRMLKDNLRISWLHTRLVFGMLPRLPSLLLRGRRS